MPISSRHLAILLCAALPAHAQSTTKKPAAKTAPKTSTTAPQSEVSPLPAPDVEFAAPVIAPARAVNQIAPATTQVEGDLAQFLSGNLVPLEIKLSGMKTGWQSLRVVRADEKSTASAPTSSGQIMHDEDFFQQLVVRFGSDNNRYFTQGQTLRLNDNTHLVVYRSQFSDLKSMENYFESRASELKNKPVDAVTVLRIVRDFLATVPVRASLLNTRNISAMEDVASFDFDKQFAGFSEVVNKEFRRSEAQQQKRIAEAKSDPVIAGNLKQLFAGIEQYSQDYDEKLPPLRDLATARKAIDPYVNNKSAWMDDLKIKLYPNALLSGKPLAHLKPYASSMILFYSDADAQGERWVLRLDGQVRQVSGAQWPQLKKAARIP